MGMVRVLSLVVVLAGQVLASGGGALFTACAPGGEMTRCPCAQKLKTEQARHPGTQLDRASCCTIERGSTPQVPLATASFHVDAFGAPLALFARLPRPVLPEPPQAVLGAEPRAQGPPVFLKVRSLLI